MLYKQYWSKFMEMRNKNINQFIKNVEPSTKKIYKNYVGILGLVIITLISMICYWSPLDKNWSFAAFQITIPMVVTLIVCAITVILKLIYMTLDCIRLFFFDVKIFTEQIYIMKFFHVVIDPIRKALDDTLFSFVFSNFLVLSIIYESSWKSITHDWRLIPSSHAYIISGTLVFISASVLVPLLLGFINSYVVTTIISSKKI